MKTDFTLPNAYDKITIVCWPTGTGGNFLINCLSLSDDCVFMDARLANDQLQGNLDATGKHRYLEIKLQEAQARQQWSDLDLGNGQFYGVRDDDWYWFFPEILVHRINPVVADVIKQDKNFFLGCHHVNAIARLKELWPNARMIFFMNYRKFLSNRPNYNFQTIISRQRQLYWNTIKSDRYPDHPPSTRQEFDQLPDWLRTELKEQFGYGIAKWFDFTQYEHDLWSKRVDKLQAHYQDSCMIWDVDRNFADQDKLFLALSAISKKIGIALVDKKILDWYYHEWRNTIEVC